MWLKHVQIPQEIRTIAIPASWLSYLWDRERRILVIKKQPPKSPEYSCGARNRFCFKLQMLPRGGISLANAEWRIERESERCIEVYYVRKLKYAEVGLWDRYWDTPEDVAKKKLLEKPCFYAKGYLVFGRVSGLEWRITNVDPEAFVFVLSYSLHSRSACAEYRVLATENIYVHDTDYACCRTYSEAALLLICDAKKPATLEYVFIDAPYRGDPEEVRKKIKITWNNGNPKTEETEDITEEEVL